ncbi:MAG: fumarate hydratase [Thermodesulfobacteriota bacterium]
MRVINQATVTGAVRDLAIAAACDLEPDILEALLAARDREVSPLSRNLLELLITNSDIASREKIPVCQDTGIAVVFVFLGREARMEGDLFAAIQEGVRQGYSEGYLRMSVCDPLTRINTMTNTPAVVHLELVEGETLRLCMLPKGCGSENMSGLAMLPPSAGKPGIIRYVVDLVVKAGSNPCPPVTVGVGIGGSFEKAALLAKQALLRPVGRPAERHDVADLEAEMLLLINEQGQGVHGMGGNNTALAVHVETCPTHIASLPVAVNIQCHAQRHKEIIL